VLEEYTTTEQNSVACFLWAKGLNAKDIHEEMFPVYGGKCLLHKPVQDWVAKFSQGQSKVTDDAQPGRPVENATEATVQRVEEFGVLMQWQRDGASVSMLVENMSRNKCFFQVQISHILCFISICDLFTDSPSYLLSNSGDGACK
jgi:hypothetical protein